MPNLHVMMLLRSLCSRDYVTEIYNWRYHYYFLTNEGIEYLCVGQRARAIICEYLHLPAEIVSATLKGVPVI